LPLDKQEVRWYSNEQGSIVVFTLGGYEMSEEDVDDREGLEPLRGGRVVIGCVDEVNGRDSIEHPEYHPSRYELMILARHWSKEYLELSWFCWFHETSGSDLYRRSIYYQRRLDRLENILGKEEMAQIVKSVEDEWVKECGEEGLAALKRNDQLWREKEYERCGLS
jgi:hypothetical protein